MGIMGICLLGIYRDEARSLAAASIGLPFLITAATSAIWTPILNSVSKISTLMASSKSLGLGPINGHDGKGPQVFSPAFGKP